MRASEISLTALDVEWRRLEVISENLANANVANSAKGVSFKALHLVSGPKSDFSAFLDAKSATKAAIDVDKLNGVEVLGVEASSAPPRKVHEPGNPQADAAGYVSYPAVDQAQEMTDMLRTSRAYEANIVALKSAGEMYGKALTIGER
ncbi:MAG TPA: flagellar basal body rod protein FlgC [Rhizomicrobium sp.]|nr:flagellar basal body rod protein FlgC [Rhizomicrobium sp.]